MANPIPKELFDMLASNLHSEPFRQEDKKYFLGSDCIIQEVKGRGGHSIDVIIDKYRFQFTRGTEIYASHFGSSSEPKTCLLLQVGLRNNNSIITTYGAATSHYQVMIGNCYPTIWDQRLEAKHKADYDNHRICKYWCEERLPCCETDFSISNCETPPLIRLYYLLRQKLINWQRLEEKAEEERKAREDNLSKKEFLDFLKTKK